MPVSAQICFTLSQSTDKRRHPNPTSVFIPHGCSAILKQELALEKQILVSPHVLDNFTGFRRDHIPMFIFELQDIVFGKLSHAV